MSAARHVVAAAAVVGVLAALAGCTTGSTEPVPTLAEEPFVCDGVPLDGIRLMTGTDEIERESSGGTWGDVTDPVVCNVRTADGSGLVTVSQEPLEWFGVGDAEAYLEEVAGRQGAQRIEAEATGGGYAYPEGEETVSAQWACGEQRVALTVYRLAGGDRDPLTDVSRYLTSMLPWACDGADAPVRTR